MAEQRVNDRHDFDAVSSFTKKEINPQFRISTAASPKILHHRLLSTVFGCMLQFKWLELSQGRAYRHRGSQRAAVDWCLHKLVMAVDRAIRKYNATPNRDVTCLGMAWARLPVNREVAGAWPSLPKIVVFWRTKRSAFLLRAFNANFLSNINSGSMFGSALLGQWWRITSRFDVALCFLNLPI